MSGATAADERGKGREREIESVSETETETETETDADTELSEKEAGGVPKQRSECLSCLVAISPQD
jgi:hypothetical protein